MFYYGNEDAKLWHRAAADFGFQMQRTERLLQQHLKSGQGYWDLWSGVHSIINQELLPPAVCWFKAHFYCLYLPNHLHRTTEPHNAEMQREINF